MAGKRIRRIFVDSPDSVGGRARAQRWELFREMFPDVETMRVLDLGGTVDAWLQAPVQPAQITIVNLYEPGDSDNNRIRPLIGDACHAAEVLTNAGCADGFDIVFSNSLIEHVGGHARRVEFAQQVRRLARHHWIQTPYRYFPVEPHWLFPGMQFLPVAARVKIATHWPLVHTKPRSVDEARREVLWTELISKTEMQDYFPGSTILPERMLGLTKSLIAAS
jgi:hypothetical protein